MADERRPMIHSVIPVGVLQCNCSIIGDEATHEAMVIDPGADVSRILELIARHGLTVKQIVITHAHVDHIGGAMKLKAATGAPILMNEADTAQFKLLDLQSRWLGMPLTEQPTLDQSLSHGDKLHVGSLEAEVLHTPGHTEGSICLYFPLQKKLIAGDTLFAGSIGRTDLPGGNTAKIMQSLRGPVMALPDETEVFPGHGPATTIGEERESNPFLS